MGLVYAEIELMNTDDLGLLRHSFIEEDDVKRLRVKMRVTSGVHMTAINEKIQSYLNLPYRERRTVRLADGSIVGYDVVGPIDIRFANRRSVCNAFVLPGNSQPLLGSTPIGEMDVVIDPKLQKLVINPVHPGKHFRI